MRLPYLQVTQETWSKARMLGAALGISKAEAFLLLCDLWAWALDLGPQDEAPTGVLLSKRADVLLAGAIGHTGDPATLLEILVDLGVVELVDGGIRVRGMSRYRRTWEKNHRSSPKTRTPGTKTAPTRHQPGADTAPQTQTQTQIKETTAQARPVAPCPVKPKREPVVCPDGETLSESLCRVWREKRQGEYVWRSADELSLRATLGFADGDTAEIVRVWSSALDRTFPRCTKVADLGRHWNEYASKGPEPGLRKADPTPEPSLKRL